MRKFRLLVLSLVLGCVAFPHRSPAPVTVRPGEGATYTAPGSEEVPNQKDAQTQYDNALLKEKSGDIGSALAGYRKTAKRFPKSTVAPSAQYKIGEILEKRKDLDGAATAYELLIRRYPHSTDFNNALEGEFRIGDAYLEGYKQRVFGVPTLPSRDRAIFIFTIITSNAPFSRYAPAAQFKIGQAFEVQGDYKGAINAYQPVVDKYPTNPLAADAQYQIAYAYMQLATKTGTYDRANTQHARDGFEDFLAAYPNHEKAAQARQDLASLSVQQTGGSLEIANYYYKQAQYRAAVVYYNDVIRQQPNSPDSTKAKARLDTIRSKYGEKYFSEASPNAPGSGLKPVVPKVGDGRLQAQTDTAKRPDYVGPPISAPTPPSAPASSGAGNLFNPPTGSGDGSSKPDPRPDATPLPVPAGDQPSLPTQ